MTEELADLIRDEIRAQGPMRFSRWMELCLYHPEHGYHTKPSQGHQRIAGTGRDADVATPPTLHPFFGRAVGRELMAIWQAAGCPDSWSVVQFGGGEGEVARAALGEIDALGSPLRRAIQWTRVDSSARHRLPPSDADPRIQYAPAARWGNHPTGPRGSDVVVACEFLRALPFDIYEKRVGGNAEVCVGLDSEGSFEFVTRAGRFAVDAPATWTYGERWVEPSEYEFWLEDGLHPRRTRALLVVDDGTRSPGRGPRAYREQTEVSPLSSPGETDIKASVDFEALRSEIEHHPEPMDLWESSYESMESFLLRHGILEELDAIDRSSAEGASCYLRLRQLLLPTGRAAAFKVARFDRDGKPQ